MHLYKMSKNMVNQFHKWIEYMMECRYGILNTGMERMDSIALGLTPMSLRCRPLYFVKRVGEKHIYKFTKRVLIKY